MKVVVTGAGGFVGRALTAYLRGAGYDVVAVGRRSGPGIDVVADLRRPTEWRSIAEGSGAFVHLAAIAHVHPPDQPSEATYRAVNTDPLGGICAGLRGTRTRLVFMSSVAAICSSATQVVNDRTLARPVTPYGRTKLEAEWLIREALANDVTEWTVLRPPLVYGPGNKGTIELLARLVRAGVPVPTGPRGVRRSFIYVGNLVDAIGLAIQAPGASRGCFLVADGEALDVVDMVARIARAYDRRGLTVPVPKSLLSAVANCSARLGEVGVRHAQRIHDMARRLLEPLVIDDCGFRNAVGWRPRLDGLAAFERSFSRSNQG